jgi:hypothetical protein
MNPQMRRGVPGTNGSGGARPVLAWEIPAIIKTRMASVLIAIIRVIIIVTATKRAPVVLRRRRRAPVLDLNDTQPNDVPQTRQPVQDDIISLDVQSLPGDQWPRFRYKYCPLRRDELGVEAPSGNKQFTVVILRCNSWWRNL